LKQVMSTVRYHSH